MGDSKFVEPLLVRSRVPVAGKDNLAETATYDEKRQLWVRRDSDLPLVTSLCSVVGENVAASTYGETTKTATSEGVDQSESSNSLEDLTCSDFGETTLTKTAEGTDQIEGSIGSEYGETVLTETREGIDQVEGSDPDDD